MSQRSVSQQIPVVGSREPCPCGSGRRYKACHGRADRERAQHVVTRPFAGLADECDWVALREIVPAATGQLHLRETATRAKATPITLATVLPLAWPAMVRTDGSVYLGAQTATQAVDPSRDLAAALVAALDAPPGSSITNADLAGDLVASSAAGPRLQDLLADKPLEVAVHAGFEFWGQDMPDPDGELAASLERASETVVPTARLTSVEAAYWCRIGSRTHLRWVLPDEEEPLLDALARLHAARELALGGGDGGGGDGGTHGNDGTHGKYIGAFRAHGLVVPVWDLAPDAEAADIEAPAAMMRQKLDDALRDDTPLSVAERRSRAGLLSRQVTLR
jgi:hypothetical protein